ncbi:MAG: PadR family transcriptional regulator [Actinomycetota bacterium]
MAPRETEERVLSQMRRGTLEYCVLAVLKRDDRYAFDLVKTLAQVDGLVTSEGTLYPLLTRLRKDGLVASSWQESPKGPPRRYYRITAKGQRALDGFAQEWRRFRSSVDKLIEEDGQ